MVCGTLSITSRMCGIQPGDVHGVRICSADVPGSWIQCGLAASLPSRCGSPLSLVQSHHGEEPQSTSWHLHEAGTFMVSASSLASPACRLSPSSSAHMTIVENMNTIFSWLESVGRSRLDISRYQAAAGKTRRTVSASVIYLDRYIRDFPASFLCACRVSWTFSPLPALTYTRYPRAARS